MEYEIFRISGHTYLRSNKMLENYVKISHQVEELQLILWSYGWEMWGDIIEFSEDQEISF